jgi:CRP-like cAMP-binding protein
MNVHKNARLTPRGREWIVCPRTVRKWVARYRAESASGLKDRSSRPHRLYRPTPCDLVAQVESLRRQRFTGTRIAKETGLSPATVSRILQRAPRTSLRTKLF